MNKKFTAAMAALTIAAALTSCSSGEDSSTKTSEAASTTTTTTAEVTTTTTKKPAEPKVKYDPDATETVITISDPDTEDWKNAMHDDYIEGITLPANTEVTVIAEIALTEETASAADKEHQIAFAPCYSDSWEKIGAEPQMIRGDFPVGADLAHAGLANKDFQLLKDAEGNISEDVYRRSDSSVMAELFVKPDGFIKFSPEVWTTWQAGETHTVTFTLSTDAVSRMRENGSGMLFQCSGGFELRKLTFSCGNVLTHDQYLDWAESAGAGAVWGQ